MPIDPLERLTRELSKLPGIGMKSATRLAFYILRSDPSYVANLVDALQDVKKKITLCSSCCNLTEENPCKICSSSSRDHGVVCVVEEPSDMSAIEKAGYFKGVYHILHGALSPLDGIGPEDLKIESLINRIKSGTFKEVIVATNPSVEGEATALYLSRALKSSGVRLTRIASGVPMGGDLEYTDQMTIIRALENRHELV